MQQNLLFTILFMLASIVLPVLAVYSLLTLGNRRMGLRYKQWWNPFIALLICIGGVYYFLHYEQYLQNHFLFKPFKGFGFVQLIYTYIIIGIWSLVKLFFHEFRNWFRKKSKHEGKVKDLHRFSIAYKGDKKEDVVLKKEWVFPSLYLKYLMYINLASFYIGSFVFNTQFF